MFLTVDSGRCLGCDKRRVIADVLHETLPGHPFVLLLDDVGRSGVADNTSSLATVAVADRQRRAVGDSGLITKTLDIVQGKVGRDCPEERPAGGPLGSLVSQLTANYVGVEDVPAVIANWLATDKHIANVLPVDNTESVKKVSKPS